MSLCICLFLLVSFNISSVLHELMHVSIFFSYKFLYVSCNISRVLQELMHVSIRVFFIGLYHRSPLESSVQGLF